MVLKSWELVSQDQLKNELKIELELEINDEMK